ncbi:MAG: hypothetical protein OJF48_003193 [Afipia sp.]|nr:MAG: hypothetical protein OJF48_003193 [Afipia sp.]
MCAILSVVIPGRAASREPGIHGLPGDFRNHGFRACAKRRIPE